MADLSDVEQEIVTLVYKAIHPDSTNSPNAIDFPCRVFRGWPTPAGLNADLQAGIANVTVFPDDDLGVTINHFGATWYDQQIPATFFGKVDGYSVIFSGEIEREALIGLLVDGQSFVHRATVGESPTVVASTLASLISSTRPAQATNARILVPDSHALSVRIGEAANCYHEIRRQHRQIRVASWCNNPLRRDKIASHIDRILATCTFVELPDSAKGRLTYRGTMVYDQAQNALLYRRDLLYTAEYPTTISRTLTPMVFGELALNVRHSVL